MKYDIEQLLEAGEIIQIYPACTNNIFVMEFTP